MKTVYIGNGMGGQKVAHAIQFGTTNQKVGSNAVQIWTLPLSWLDDGRVGSDFASCYKCPFSELKGGGCYVRKGNSAKGLYSMVRSLKSSERLPLSALRPEWFADKFVRFGAYGESVLMGEELIADITKYARTWTGYTHLHNIKRFDWAKNYFMASVESEEQAIKAQANGWRTYRVRSKDEPKMQGEVICPASKEAGKRLQCNACTLCNGQRKNATIIKH